MTDFLSPRGGPGPVELPPQEDWARLALEERKKWKEEQRKKASLPVARKHTASSRAHSTVDPESAVSGLLRSLLKDEEGGESRAAAEVALPDYVRQHRENMRDFLDKKRQIFLVQMALDTKRTEISKLDQRSRQRAEALQASEDALEEDAKHFDEYLKDNDQKLQEALRKAEAEAKARMEKVNEAKKLAASIVSIKNEVQRIQEQLQECQRYKEFVNKITPEEWFESLKAARNAKKAGMKEGWLAECAVLAQKKQDAAAAKQRAEHDMQWARTQQQFDKAERAYREALVMLRDAMAQQDPPEPNYSMVDDEEEGMYFGDPAQLLEVFSQLEGRNMFMIQTVQDGEQRLEAAKAAQAQAEETLGAEVASLQRQVQEMEAAIATAADTCARLQEATNKNFEGGGGQNSISLDSLVETLTRVYEQCGFSADASMTPLQMLAKIEARMEDHISTVDSSLPPGFAEQVERSREKARRDTARQAKLAGQQAEHEARIRRVLDRAAAPAFKKTGKPAMFRSTVRHKQQKKASVDTHDEEEELKAYLEME